MSPSPMLAESWSISSDFMTWSWKFQEGVQFHKGYGEMTAEDVLYSYQQWYAGARHPRSRIIGDYFNSGFRIVDDYTLEIDTDVPWVPAQVFEFVKNGGGSSSWVVSKKQSEEIGVAAANRDIAATGPWQIEDHQNYNYWRMSAVEDHWRQPLIPHVILEDFVEIHLKRNSILTILTCTVPDFPRKSISKAFGQGRRDPAESRNRLNRKNFKMELRFKWIPLKSMI